MSKQSTRSTTKQPQRPNPVGLEASNVILAAFGGVFLCIFLAGAWSLWNSPCSWVATTLRDTGCLIRLGDTQSSVAFLDGGEQWLHTLDEFLIVERLHVERTERIPFQHPTHVERFVVSADESTVATISVRNGATPRQLWVWDIATQTVRWQKQINDTTQLASLAADGSRLVLALDDRRQLWDINSGELLVQMEGWSLTLSPDGSAFVVGSEAGLTLYDANTFAPSKTFAVPEGIAVSCPTFSPDGRWLTVGNTQTLQIVDVESEAVIFTLPASNRFHRCAFTFAPDGKTLAISTFTPEKADSVVDFWDIESGMLQQQIDVHYTFPLQIVVSPNGQEMAIGGAETVYLIDIAALSP